MGSLLYALKPPLDEYKVVIKQGDTAGEVVWDQRKVPLRKGNAALTASLLTGVEIDQIAFAGGTAGSSVQRIATAARQRLALGEEELVSEIERRRQAGGR